MYSCIHNVFYDDDNSMLSDSIQDYIRLFGEEKKTLNDKPCMLSSGRLYLCIITDLYLTYIYLLEQFPTNKPTHLQA